MARENCLAVIGPTASGKTKLGVRLAERLRGTILSVDSRQVYRGLDIGAGKDLSEYRDEAGRSIPHRLIDIADLDREYSVFDFQNDFYRAFEETLAEERLAVAVGGTGLYLEAALEGYEMVRVEPNPELREELEPLSTEELRARLRSSKKELHNTTDFVSRERTIRAIEIALGAYERNNYFKPPTEEQGLAALVEEPTSDPKPQKWRQYMEEVPKDPWGNEYQYRVPATRSGKAYDLFSLGQDGVESEDDIGNWK